MELFMPGLSRASNSSQLSGQVKTILLMTYSYNLEVLEQHCTTMSLNVYHIYGKVECSLLSYFVFTQTFTHNSPHTSSMFSILDSL